nr:hypothetical protein [Tanacetum cinerariifolium]
RDHYTTSAGVNIIGGVITSASSDQISNTIATCMSSSVRIYNLFAQYNLEQPSRSLKQGERP